MPIAGLQDGYQGRRWLCEILTHGGLIVYTSSYSEVYVYVYYMYVFFWIQPGSRTYISSGIGANAVFQALVQHG